MAEAKTESKSMKNVPMTVKIIAVFYWLSAAALVVAAIIGLVAGGKLIEIIPLLAFISAIIAIFSVIFLIFAALSFFIGLGLWKGKKWARVFVIVISMLGLFVALVSIVGTFNIQTLVIGALNGIIGFYLIISKEVKEAFS